MTRHSMWSFLPLLCASIFSGCATLENHSTLEQPTNSTLRASVGQTVFRIQKTRDLPNAFGKADLFGRKVDAGYQELRYVGMADDSTLIFTFRDREIYSNETTMSRTGTGFVNLQNTGSSTTGTVIAPPSSTTQALPAYEVQIKHNIRENSTLEHSGIKITIIKASPSEVTYSLSK